MNKAILEKVEGILLTTGLFLGILFMVMYWR